MSPGRCRTEQCRTLSAPQLLAAAVGSAATLAALLVAASVLTAHDTHPEAEPGPARSLFGGIEQHGASLGSPTAPVTLVEDADLQCPYCAAWARAALPVVVNRYVRTGKVRLVFSGLTFIGPDSLTALRTVVAAGQKDHLWDVVDGTPSFLIGATGGALSRARVGSLDAAGITPLLDEALAG